MAWLFFRSPQQHTLHTWLTRLVVLSLLLVPMGLIRPTAGANAVGMRTLRWYGLTGGGQWVDTLDPAMATDTISGGVVGMTYSGLVKVLPDGTIAPDLSKTITESPNHLVYTFTLLPNLKFSNGDVLTAHDVVWSLTRALARKTASPVGLAYLGHIKGAAAYNAGKANAVSGLKVVSSSELTITVDSPIAFFLSELSYATGDVLDPHIVIGKQPGSYLTQTCSANVVSGPFMFQCRNTKSAMSSFYAPGQTPSISLVPNPYYHGTKPDYKVYMPAIASTQANYQDFQDGGIDVTSVLAVQVDAVKHRKGFVAYSSSQVDYLTPNLQAAPFNNEHCRVALSYALNRDVINKNVLHGAQYSVYDVLPKGILGYYNGADSPHYNQSKARAEWKLCPSRHKSFTLVYPQISSDAANENRAVQNMWRAAGIKAKIDGVPYNSWLQAVSEPMHESHTAMVENGWVQDYPDPYDYCTLLLRGGQNYDIGGYNDPSYNTLVDEAAVDADPSTRAQLYIKAQHLAVGSGAWIPIGVDKGYALVKPRVHGLIGSEAFSELVPTDNDWSRVSISS